MAQNSGTKQYFLGIEGEQTGPFSESDILARIKKSMIPGDALVWHEGMSDWLPINTVEPFQTTLSMVEKQFSAPAAEPVPPYKAPAYKPKPPSQSGVDDPFLMSPADGEPVYGASRGGGPKISAKLILGLLGFLAIGGSAFYFQDDVLALVGMGADAVPEEPQKPKKVVQIDVRQVNLGKAQSELMLTPEASLKTLGDIARANPSDKIGQEALQTAVDYYRKVQRPVEAARLYMDCKRPAEAAKLFAAEQPPLHKEAEEAYYAAYKAAPEGEKRNLLIEDIRILLGPLNNVALATERIRELEKVSPGPHPFMYYSKSLDEKLADMFARISFYFVQNLLSYIQSELPQVNLVNRPLIEIKRDKGNVYRVVGTYKGDVKLNQDRLSDIYFVFWLVNDQWTVVDTNLTEERKKFAKQQREKVRAQALNAEGMLEYLQNVFHTQFPTTALHERIDASAKKRSAATIE